MRRAARALLKASIPAPSPKHLATIVDLYREAVPATRRSAAAVERNATLYPARPTMPDFTRVHAADSRAGVRGKKPRRVVDLSPRHFRGREFPRPDPHTPSRSLPSCVSSRQALRILKRTGRGMARQIERREPSVRRSTETRQRRVAASGRKRTVDGPQSGPAVAPKAPDQPWSDDQTEIRSPAEEHDREPLAERSASPFIRITP